MSSDSRRRLDNRLDDIERRLRSLAVNPATTPQTRVVTVYGNPTVPSVPNVYYSCEPAVLRGAEQEGGAGTATITHADLKVFVFGPVHPVAGSALRARRVAPGRWVAQNWSQPLPTGSYVECQVGGCNGMIPGASVSIVGDDGSSFSGTTDGTGTLLVGGLTPGNFTFTFSDTSGRFLATSVYQTVHAGTTPTSPQLVAFGLTVAPGYHCCNGAALYTPGGFLYPLKDTLHLSGAGITLTLAYNATNFDWRSTTTAFYNVPACATSGCPAKTVRVGFTGLCNAGSGAHLTYPVKIDAGKACADPTGTPGGASFLGVTVTSPPPSFAATLTLPAETPPSSDALTCNAGATFTLTE